MSSQFALIVIGLVAGYVARRLGRFSDDAADVLNRFVIDICVPAMILLLVPKLHLEWDLVVLAVIPWILALVAFGCSWVVGRLLRLEPRATAVLFLCTALGNTSFLGFPMCSALLGEASIPLAAVYDQLGSFLLLSTVVPWVIARAAGHGSPSIRAMARRVLAFPPFIALLLAVLPWPQPLWLSEVLEALGAALVPVAMFAVGLRLRITPPPEKGAFVVGLGIKLVLMPLLAWSLGRAFGASPEILAVAVLESAMPAMITAGAIAMAEGLAPALAASLIGWGIVAAQVTVPAWAALVR